MLKSVLLKQVTFISYRMHVFIVSTGSANEWLALVLTQTSHNLINVGWCPLKEQESWPSSCKHLLWACTPLSVTLQWQCRWLCAALWCKRKKNNGSTVIDPFTAHGSVSIYNLKLHLTNLNLEMNVVRLHTGRSVCGDCPTEITNVDS